jgi:hypothetical protein
VNFHSYIPILDSTPWLVKPDTLVMTQISFGLDSSLTPITTVQVKFRKHYIYVIGI